MDELKAQLATLAEYLKIYESEKKCLQNIQQTNWII